MDALLNQVCAGQKKACVPDFLKSILCGLSVMI